MTEKLSERLERAASDKALPIGEAWALLDEAACIVRAFEDAPEAGVVTPSFGCERGMLFSPPSLIGKRVRLVEVK